MAVSKLTQRLRAKRAKHSKNKAPKTDSAIQPSPQKSKSPYTGHEYSSKKSNARSALPRFIPFILLALAAAYLLIGNILFTKANSNRTTPNIICSGVCRLEDHDNEINECAIEPRSLLFLRIPKTASTSVLSAFREIGERKGFQLRDLPDYPPAVGGNPRKVGTVGRNVQQPAERRRFYQGVMTIIALQSAPPAKNVWFGHLFLPDFTMSRHFSDNKKEKKPLVITMVRNPIERLNSEYNYLRNSARTVAHQREVINTMGNQSLATCAKSSTCVEVNSLRRMCSTQALYICGDHNDCLDISKKDKIISRAKKNIDEEFLLIGLVEKIGETMGLLEKIAPTYFQYAGEVFELVEQTRGGGPETTNHNDKDFRSPNTYATNTSPEYEKPPSGDRDLEEICEIDMAVYAYAKEKFESKLASCKNELLTALPDGTSRRVLR